MHNLKLAVLGLPSLLVGPRRGITMRLANEKSGAADEKDKEVTTYKSPEHWKRKTALAINADPKMSDEDLEQAHDEHMLALTHALANDAVASEGLSITNEDDRRGIVLSLVNDKMSTGLDYTSAFIAVQRERPELFR